MKNVGDYLFNKLKNHPQHACLRFKPFIEHHLKNNPPILVVAKGFNVFRCFPVRDDQLTFTFMSSSWFSLRVISSDACCHYHHVVRHMVRMELHLLHFSSSGVQTFNIAAWRAWRSKRTNHCQLVLLKRLSVFEHDHHKRYLLDSGCCKIGHVHTNLMRTSRF